MRNLFVSCLTCLGLLFLHPSSAFGDGCNGCTPESSTDSSDPSSTTSETKTTVGGVTYTVKLIVNVTVYGADCVEDGSAPIVCKVLDDGKCSFYVDAEYFSGFGGLSFTSFTLNPPTYVVLRRNLPAAPSGSQMDWERRDSLDCGLTGHQVRFGSNWVSDGLTPSAVYVDVEFGCTACEMGGN